MNTSKNSKIRHEILASTYFGDYIKLQGFKFLYFGWKVLISTITFPINQAFFYFPNSEKNIWQRTLCFSWRAVRNRDLETERPRIMRILFNDAQTCRRQQALLGSYDYHLEFPCKFEGDILALNFPPTPPQRTRRKRS